MKPSYGNWISNSMLKTFFGVAFGLFAVSQALAFTLGKETYYYVACILCTFATAAALYMSYCHYVFSFGGGGLMRRIHNYLLEHLAWNGKGTLLDVGCGSGALSIAAAKQFPTAKISATATQRSRASARAAHSCPETLQRSTFRANPLTPSSAILSITKSARKRINSCSSRRPCAR